MTKDQTHLGVLTMNKETFFKKLAKHKGEFIVRRDQAIRTKKRYRIGGGRNQLCPIEIVYKDENNKTEAAVFAAEELRIDIQLSDAIMQAADDSFDLDSLENGDLKKNKFREKMLKVLDLKEREHKVE
ncbi:hypothetical protein C4577_02855 [Candidatus Parcubacteria bacterium]|nr:MAG: hypothetical protein C4577_02855 [Candidatus Parcubacteria bacterium]